MKKIYAFIKKDFLIEKNYKFTFFINLFSLSITLLIFYFINSYFKFEIEKYLKNFEINYFAYVFVSFLVFNYSGGNSIITQKISFDISGGVFEFIILKDKIPFFYITSLVIYNFVIATVEGFLYFFLVLLFGFKDFSINFVSLLVVLVISAVVFSSFALMSASFIIIFKRGDIVAFIIGILEGIFGGVYYPVEILGEKFFFFSKFLPITYSIKAFQKIFYSKASLVDIKNELMILLIFLIFLFPFSFFIFNYAVKLSKKMGKLNQY